MQAQSSRHGLCHRIPTLFGSVRLATTRLLGFGQRSGCRWWVLYPFVVCSFVEMGRWQCCVKQATKKLRLSVSFVLVKGYRVRTGLRELQGV